jgi:hypothetical protein
MKNKTKPSKDTTANENKKPIEHPSEGGVYARHPETEELIKNPDGSLFRHDVETKAADAASESTEAVQ